MTRPAAAAGATFVALGPFILDVLGRPVTHIPEGQGSARLTEMTITVAGTAGGTAVDLARLGAVVRGVGAIGDDALGRFLRTQLESVGVDTAGLVEIPGVPTSGTILPIRPNGERPALHLPGATAHLTASAVAADALDGADYVHVGGPDVLGEFMRTGLVPLLERARAGGAVISADLLSPGDPQLYAALAPVHAQVEHLLINDQQAANLTGLADPAAAAERLFEGGPACVVVTCGSAGGVLHDASGPWSFPALPVTAIDTTGCGDAFSAGYLHALSEGLPARRRCEFATCCAAQVAQVLGSDGITGRSDVLDLLATHFPA